MKFSGLIPLLLLSWACNAADAQPSDAGSLDELLTQVREIRTLTNRVNSEREQRFLSEKETRQQQLGEARAAQVAEQSRSDELQQTFDENEKRIIEFEQRLHERSGSLNELAGIYRQVWGDARALLKDSLVSTQLSGRMKNLDTLALQQGLPSIQQLEELWFTLQQEMTESGKVSSYPAQVVAADGGEQQQNITRVGSFNVISSGKFLRYQAATGKLEELPRQPSARYRRMATALEQAPSGSVPMVIDPSRGAVLDLLMQVPDVGERIRQGRLVGYIIIALSLAGLLVVLERAWRLTVTGRRIKAQLRNNTPNPGNPLGRVMAVYEDNREIDTETLELKIDEAILKNTPGLQRGLGTIKMLAVIAPMLGLLGTVTGLIETFQSITLFGTGDPRLMAGGISQALITTVLGLGAAIPLILLHTGLSGKSKRLLSILEEQSAGIIAAHAEQERPHAAAT